MRARPLLSSVLLSGLAAFALAACGPTEPDTSGIADAELSEQASYVIGFGFGDNLRQNIERDSVDLDFDLIMQGVREGYRGDSSRLSDEEVREVMQAFQEEVTAQVAAREARESAVARERNVAEADSFLAANASAEGVQTTDSGLQYVVLQEGDGPTPSPEDVVRVNYEGRFVNGEVFDSSYQRGQPAQFPVGGVISGWTEALQLMQVGSKYRLHVPPALAYGENAPPNIGPNRLLIFDVELLGIEGGD